MIRKENLGLQGRHHALLAPVREVSVDEKRDWIELIERSGKAGHRA